MSCHVRESEMQKDNLERFFSSAARPGASTLCSVRVVVGKEHPLMRPLQPLSCLSSALLFQPADPNLVASATLVQRLRQGPICSFEIINQVASLLLSQLRVPAQLFQGCQESFDSSS